MSHYKVKVIFPYGGTYEVNQRLIITHKSVSSFIRIITKLIKGIRNL